MMKSEKMNWTPVPLLCWPDLLAAASLLCFAIVFRGNPAFAGNDAPALECGSGVDRLVSRARGGDAYAMYLAGRSFEKGICVERNSVVAVNWYEKAVAKGVPEARHALAELLIRCNDKCKEGAIDRALGLLSENMRNRFAPSATLLGEVYAAGSIVRKDAVRARKYWEEAAKQSEPVAMFNLALMYESGDSVAVDHARGLALLKESARSFEGAWEELCKTYYNGGRFGVSRNLDAARRWCLAAATGGRSAAQSILATMHFRREASSSDGRDGRYWLRRAADDGNSEAQFVLGYMLANGAEGFKKDLNEARRYVEMSASAGNDKAAEFLRAIQGDQK